jgi:hypothetical protein
MMWAEAKLSALTGKAAALFLLIAHAETVIGNWAVLATLLAALIAPDLFKKVVSMRMGKTP